MDRSPTAAGSGTGTGLEAAPARGVTRLLRLTCLGGGSLLLASAAHSTGGGQLPATGLMVAVALLLGCVSICVTSRRRSFGSLLALLSVEQVLLHAVFSLTSHHHHLADAARCLFTPGGLADVLSTPDAGMSVGHCSAVVATAWLLARGEAWLWTTAERAIRCATAAPTTQLASFFVLVAAFSAAWAGSTLPLTAEPRGPPSLFAT